MDKCTGKDLNKAYNSGDFTIQIGVYKFGRCRITFQSYEAGFAVFKRYLIDDIIIGKNQIFVELSWRL